MGPIHLAHEKLQSILQGHDLGRLSYIPCKVVLLDGCICSFQSPLNGCFYHCGWVDRITIMDVVGMSKGKNCMWYRDAIPQGFPA